MKQSKDDGSRRAKNIAAILYLIVLTFLVGGSYLHQQRQSASVAADVSTIEPAAASSPADTGVAN